jgi:hypothetical protein
MLSKLKNAWLYGGLFICLKSLKAIIKKKLFKIYFGLNGKVGSFYVFTR